MGKKQDNIQKLYKARTAHLKWVNDIKFLISGVYTNNTIPKPTLHDSEVGDWFYSNALQFSQFNSRLVLDDMEKILEDIYNVYSNIFSIYSNAKENKIKSLFGMRNGVSNYESKQASLYYDEIIELSDKFKSRLKTFESQILALDEEKHNLIQDFTELKDVSPVNNLSTHKESLKEYNYGPRG
jgi:hypothetical protein